MIKKISAQLENMFDQFPQSTLDTGQSFIEIQNNFQIINDNSFLENLSYVFSGEINNANLYNLFSQLSSYFEIGFLFKSTETTREFIVISSFVYMQKIRALDTLSPLKLPSPGACKVLKTQAYPILKRLNMRSLDPSKKMSAYLLPVTSNYNIMLITQVAEPWASLKIESLQKTFMKINFNL